MGVLLDERGGQSGRVVRRERRAEWACCMATTELPVLYNNMCKHLHVNTPVL